MYSTQQVCMSLQDIRFLNSVCVVYLEMADLLREFTDPAVMDLKMGVR